MRKNPSSKSGLAKITRPSLSSTVYPRGRLFNHLDRVRKTPVIFISAVPGSGKTTLIASYIEAKKIPCLWYQCDSSDSDVQTFFYYLGRAAAKAAPREKSLPNLTPEYLLNLPVFAGRYFRNLFSRLKTGGLLVFDNYQEVAEKSVLHEVMRRGLSEIPEGLNVVFISRREVPMELSSMRANDKLTVINGRQMRLSIEESRKIINRRSGKGRLRAQTIKYLHESSGGWAAGLTLLMEGGIEPGDMKAGSESKETVYSYFAGEIFKNLDKKRGDFLLRTSIFSVFTPEMAEKLTGNPKTGYILSSLSRNNYFIEKRHNPRVVYQYHQLFREFLLERAQNALSKKERGLLLRRAAELLEQAGRSEEAVHLLETAGDFDGVTRLALFLAPTLAGQARYGDLREMLGKIPQKMSKRNPWTLYWSGTASLPFDPHGARHHYEMALERFHKAKEVNGIYMSWAGIVDTFIFSWDDFRPLDQWIKWMEVFMRENPGFPSPEVEARIVFAMFCSLMYRDPRHPDMPIWSQRLGRMLEHIPDKNRRIAIATHYVLYLAWMGEFEEATAVIERLKSSANIDTVQPVNLIAWYQTDAMHSWLTANFNESRKSVQAGLALAEKTGIHLWDFILRVQDAYLALESTNPDHWQSYLEKILVIMDENGRLHQSHYYYFAALEALLQKSHERALLHIRKSSQAAVELGTPYPEALNCIAMGRILVELAKYEEAVSWLTRANTLAEQINSTFLTFNLHLAQAELSYARSDDKTGVTALAQAMAIGSRKNYLNTDWWRPYAMCELCIKALENNIEVDYVQKLVIKRKMNPESPPLHLDNWPWQVKIYTLGRFSVVIDDRPVRLSAKGQKKPIELLKTLIALGGREVSEERITEALWPDADGDMAHSAFTTTLSRLRKLLSGDVLIVSDGRLSLNDRLCRLDTWAFERRLGELENLLSSDHQEVEQVRQLMQKVFDLYNGPFLAKETEMSWILGPRERLRLKLLRVIKRLISFYGKSGLCREVIALYEKALDMDQLSEEYYRGLMQCHAGRNNRAGALAVYSNCRNLLYTTFGIEPSEKTVQLYQAIKDNDHEHLSRICEACRHS